MQRQNVITTESIEKLMDIFYAKIRVHKDLGEIFNNAIGTDDAHWEAHKSKIALFWRSMLLGESVYGGSPLKTHLDLPPFGRELFDVWLGLFEDSLLKVFDKDIADEILLKAKMISNRFIHMLYEVPH